MASAHGFYGQCQLCDCDYMGSANHSCGCGHSASHHIPLLACARNDCLCNRFTSTDAIPQCYSCLHGTVEHQIEQRGDIEFNQLKAWVAQGISQTDMTHLYSKKFGYTISLRSLQRKLSDYCLRVTDRNVTDEQIMTSIRLEVGNGIKGYHTMHKVLRSKYGLLVSRSRVHYLMRSHEDIPKGRDPKIVGRRYDTKPFIFEYTKPELMHSTSVEAGLKRLRTLMEEQEPEIPAKDVGCGTTIDRTKHDFRNLSECNKRRKTTESSQHVDKGEETSMTVMTEDPAHNTPDSTEFRVTKDEPVDIEIKLEPEEATYH